MTGSPDRFARRPDRDAILAAMATHAPADALIREAAHLQRDGRLAEALTAWRRVVALEPARFELWSALGSCAMRAEAPEEGLAAFRRAVELEPMLAGTWFNLGNALNATGATDAAADAFERSLERDPAMLPARINLGDLRLRQGRAADALGHFERVLAADPAAPRAAYNLGVALLALDRHDAAAGAFRAAVDRDPTDLEALNNLCVALMRGGRYAEALAASERYTAASPGNRKPLAYQAAALIELGRRDEARALLDFERLVRRHRVPTPPGHPSVAAFNEALTAAVMAHPTLAYEPPDKATRGGYQSEELFVPAPGGTAVAPPLLALKALIVAAVGEYMAGLRATLPAHPYTSHLPARWQLASWAVVLEAQGHQGPHFHPDGYVSGVYYARLPSVMRAGAGDAGCIEFGRTADHIGGAREPLIEVLRPEEGLMLLFPSYVYHRTIPFEGSEPRVCIAFDAVPVPG
jgi:tetratricopeptide (TPR) repeat protein